MALIEPWRRPLNVYTRYRTAVVTQPRQAIRVTFVSYSRFRLFYDRANCSTTLTRTAIRDNEWRRDKAARCRLPAGAPPASSLLTYSLQRNSVCNFEPCTSRIGIESRTESRIDSQVSASKSRVGPELELRDQDRNQKQHRDRNTERTRSGLTAKLLNLKGM
ncbi:hypothetical protein EVAR_99157_1 [Eumeta japonica]|uniref:Uncharacterized protein n=1 Tax=Eumeta variegata TaxID=151549 RepID=A0A4C1YE00_EUMVA|nr:hypothetical protein EVAR_99157_1 [Eumeta japonica]